MPTTDYIYHENDSENMKINRTSNKEIHEKNRALVNAYMWEYLQRWVDASVFSTKAGRSQRVPSAFTESSAHSQ